MAEKFLSLAGRFSTPQKLQQALIGFGLASVTALKLAVSKRESTPSKTHALVRLDMARDLITSIPEMLAVDKFKCRDCECEQSYAPEDQPGGITVDEAESIGWRIDPDALWLCPDCVKAIELRKERTPGVV